MKWFCVNMQCVPMDLNEKNKRKVLPNWESVWLCDLLETKTSDCHEGQLSQIERFYRGREEWNQ